MLGSVAFDGFSRTTWWQERLYSIDASLALERPRMADLAALERVTQFVSRGG
jgi:hypothetical protein